MQQHHNEQGDQTKKNALQNIAAGSEEKTKENTDTLSNDQQVADRREGNMDNGELGANLKKEQE